MKAKYKHTIIYILLAFIIIIAWQYFGSNNNKVRLFISYPTLILEYFGQNSSDLMSATFSTFVEAVAGLLIATAFSFIVMIICFIFPKFLNFIMPIMITSQVIPLIVLAPFFVLLFGMDYSSKIAMASLISFFPIFVNFATGVKSIKKEIIDYTYINNASTYDMVTQIFFPLSLPNIITGMRISSTLAVIGAIVAEFSGAVNGIGKNLFISAMRIEPELMMSSLFLSIFIGLFLYYSISLSEKIFLNWKQ